MSGEWQASDSFFLMTDALSQWFLKQSETLPDGMGVWYLDSVSSKDSTFFLETMETEWRLRKLRNDDLTLVRVTFG